MISQAIVDLKARNGASRAALKKYLLSNFKEINYEAFDRSLRTALKRGVENGMLIQNKQSFKLSSDARKSIKPKKRSSSSQSTQIRAVTQVAVAKKAVAPKKKVATKKKTSVVSKKKTTSSTKSKKKIGTMSPKKKNWITCDE